MKRVLLSLLLLAIDAVAGDPSPPWGAALLPQLQELSRPLAETAGRLRDGDAGAEVRALQLRVETALADIIAKLAADCEACRPALEPKSDSDPSDAGSEAPVPNTVAASVGVKDLSRLPPRARAQIEQTRNEGFPPGYERVLEQYYRRLAEEETRDEEHGQ